MIALEGQRQEDRDCEVTWVTKWEPISRKINRWNK